MPSFTVSTQQNPSVCHLTEYDKEASCKKKEAQKNKMMSKSLPVKEVRGHVKESAISSFQSVIVDFLLSTPPLLACSPFYRHELWHSLPRMTYSASWIMPPSV